MEEFIIKAIAFLEELKENNNREWFQENRVKYDEVMDLSKDFINKVGLRLKEFTPEIIYVPAVNKSIFRINRDIRFSKDKSPYKTNLGFLFWEGSRPKMECPGYYFHLEPGKLFLGNGLYQFNKDLLKIYREKLSKNSYNKELDEIRIRLEKKGYTLGGKHYKKYPRGINTEVKNPELLLYNGIYSIYEINDPLEVKDKLIDFVIEHYKNFAPLHNFILDLFD